MRNIIVSLIVMVFLLGCKREKTIYIVKKGDTLSEIALKYNQSYENIARWNEMSNLNIKEGQQITIYLTPSANTKFINDHGGKSLVNEINGIWVSDNGVIIKFKKSVGDIFSFNYFNDSTDYNETTALFSEDYYRTAVYLVESDQEYLINNFENCPKDKNWVLLEMDNGAPFNYYSYHIGNKTIIDIESGAIFKKK